VFRGALETFKRVLSGQLLPEQRGLPLRGAAAGDYCQLGIPVVLVAPAQPGRGAAAALPRRWRARGLGGLPWGVGTRHYGPIYTLGDANILGAYIVGYLLIHSPTQVLYGDRAEHCWNGFPELPNSLSRLRCLLVLPLENLAG
jgi:hypothetical protein